jgi:acyl transferase domain-containing protein
MTPAPEAVAPDGIAIIGMSGRFPGARNLSEFWNNLRHGVESISFFSAAKAAASGAEPRITQNPNFVNAGGILDDIELFDAAFFGINAREAETLDPQQRLLLECAWQAMEDAGYDPDRCRGPVGVYAGSAMSSYLFHLLAKPGHRDLVGDFLTFTSNDKDFLPTRVSYKLNLRGPSIAVQTACSTSLVAVAMACDGLLAHQCDMALAGGVAIRVPQKSGYIFQEGQIFSRDGHTRSFDAEASGTLFSNGMGLVVLKRLADAIEDGDCIRAVIRGTAINNDGSAKVGYAAPGLDAQAEVVTLAHALAGVDPRSIGYVEAHGTATPMGDPIEVAALTKAFRAGTQDNGFCALGSVKANVGHLDTASGVAALMKAVLCLEHGEIPPAINFTRPNPAIDFGKSPFYVNKQLTPWKAGATPRRAGVHSFGIGGTNAHVVIEEAPAAQSLPSAKAWQLLVMSARSKSALQTATDNFAAYFEQHPQANVADVAYTTQIGRREFPQRRILVCRDAEDAVSALTPLDPQRVLTGTKPPGEGSLAFLFPGPGTQAMNMGLEIYRTEPRFREGVDAGSDVAKTSMGFDLREVLYPPSESKEAAALRLNLPKVGELALFVFEYALARLWMEWGIVPQVMIGQGVGELVAACIAGVFSLPDAVSLLVGSAPAKVRLNPPQIPFVSNATGTWITAAVATDPNYWITHARRAERFSEGLGCVMKASDRILLEVGPGHTLADIAQVHPDRPPDQAVISSMPQHEENASDLEVLLTALGRLWLAGAKVDWTGFWGHEKRRRIPLPTYAFDRKRFWVDPPRRDEPAPDATGGTPAKSDASRSCADAPLSQKAMGRSADSYVPPNDDVERRVAEIWQSLLGVERVGLYDNFFLLGGHSMLGAQLLSLLRSAFQVEVPLPSLFEAPTVAGMAERIRAFQ